VFNPEATDLPLMLPPGRWQCLLDSTGLAAKASTVHARSLRVLKRTSP
jgi:hypothetical protein